MDEDLCSFASIQKLLSKLCREICGCSSTVDIVVVYLCPLADETSDERRLRKRNKEIEMNKYFREVGFEKICKDEREKVAIYGWRGVLR